MKFWFPIMASRLLILLLCLGFVAQAQTDLKSPEVRAHHQKDTAFVNILNKRAREVFAIDPEQTRRLAAEALSLSDSLHYNGGRIEAFLNNSLLSSLKGNSSEALDFQMRALKISSANGDSLYLGRIYAALGLTYYRMNDLEVARQYYDHALRRYTLEQNQLGVAEVLRQIGNVLLTSPNKNESLRYYHKALAYEKQLNHYEGIANVLNNISIVYRSRGELDKAQQYIEEAIVLHKKTNNLNRLPTAYFNLNRVFLQQGKTEEAFELAMEELRIARQLQLKSEIQEAAWILSDVYLQKKDYEKALMYFRWKEALADSIHGQESSRNFRRMQSLYENEKKEQELNLLKAERSLSQFRNRIVYIGLVAVIIIGVLVIITQRNRIKREKEIADKNEQLHAAQQLLTRADLENRAMAEKQLQQDLEFRHKELLTYTLNLVQKNALMESLREGIQELLATTDKDSKMKLTKLIKVIDYGLESEKDWDEFRMYFEKVHSSFFQKLKSQFPDLTQSDLKLCALLSLNLSMKEMAELMGISPESVKMARHRLRKKLNLVTEENLAEFIANFKNG
jgi:tetratricopeptide (TPR) repeat protein